LSAPPFRQLAFGFATGVSLARADFVAADSNRLALAWLDRADAWPAGRLVLSGPPGSGKTHLAAIFAQEAQAPVLAPEALTHQALPGLLPAHGRVVVEAADQAAEQPLLHLLNLAAETGGRVLLTARRPASSWGVRLADLRSRLAAGGHAGLGIPDETLLRAVLAKAASDRQLRLGQPVLDWLVARLPRDLAAAAGAIAALDAAALAAGRPADLWMARLVLGACDEIPMTTPASPSRPDGALL
jgi:chromosomal replication initiation ATPase DnaA